MDNDRRVRKERPMRFLPVAIDVKDKPVVLFGGGKVALQKLQTILIFGPQVTVVAPEVLPEIAALPVRCVIGPYDQRQISGSVLVYACTSDREVNRSIARDAAAAGVLCNVADDVEASVFISPAVMVEGDLVVAINSQGRDPGMAKCARDFIKDRIHEFLHDRDRAS